ncbi:hypothetical protein EJ04DRAFT_245399 [Polyplosphaeria fusca]|uniref:Uncharacterized protein n=1 Tax=Polyplosphaeria fusca TaxID=682080 RepID=A0A9P4V2L9_9PLEO|nr:hypothetical protein EJ04DRAFT_245399 [Polyplosphaeria fusca]
MNNPSTLFPQIKQHTQPHVARHFSSWAANAASWAPSSRPRASRQQDSTLDFTLLALPRLACRPQHAGNHVRRARCWVRRLSRSERRQLSSADRTPAVRGWVGIGGRAQGPGPCRLRSACAVGRRVRGGGRSWSLDWEVEGRGGQAGMGLGREEGHAGGAV